MPTEASKHEPSTQPTVCDTAAAVAADIQRRAEFE